jgi:hypothetical protein
VLRAVAVGFVLGFALVGVFLLAGGSSVDARLAHMSALKPGAAVNHVSRRADDGCGEAKALPQLPFSTLI